MVVLYQKNQKIVKDIPRRYTFTAYVALPFNWFPALCSCWFPFGKRLSRRTGKRPIRGWRRFRCYFTV